MINQGYLNEYHHMVTIEKMKSVAYWQQHPICHNCHNLQNWQHGCLAVSKNIATFAAFFELT